MNFKNFWLAKRNEKNVLKVVEWAHRNSILIENISLEQIMDANLLFLRNSSHF
jgi:hypothetical protein